MDHCWHPLGNPEAAHDVFFRLFPWLCPDWLLEIMFAPLSKRSFTLQTQHTMSTPKLLDLKNNPLLYWPFYQEPKMWTGFLMSYFTSLTWLPRETQGKDLWLPKKKSSDWGEHLHWSFHLWKKLVADNEIPHLKNPSSNKKSWVGHKLTEWSKITEEDIMV